MRRTTEIRTLLEALEQMDAIEARYEEIELKKVLWFAEPVGSLAVIDVAWLAGDARVAEAVLEKFKERRAT